MSLLIVKVFPKLGLEHLAVVVLWQRRDDAILFRPFEAREVFET
jgi:hypothetical protein